MPRLDYSENWKTVHGYPAYEVSDLGKVRSYWTRKGWTSELGMVISKVPKFLKMQLASGRLVVTLGTGSEGGQKTFGVAYLVLLAFDRSPIGKEVARHKNDPNPENCRLDNLEWGSSSENVNDIIRHKGKHHSSKLYPVEVKEIMDAIKNRTISQRQLAFKYRVSPATITLIKQGKSQKLRSVRELLNT